MATPDQLTAAARAIRAAYGCSAHVEGDKLEIHGPHREQPIVIDYAQARAVFTKANLPEEEQP